VRHRLYIDESGDHGYGQMADLGTRFLALTGLIIDAPTYRSRFHPALQDLKQTFFPHDPDDPIVFHRKEIVDRSGPFKVLQSAELREAFNDAFIEFVQQQPYGIITVVLDKKEHIDRYGPAAFHPYHYCLTAIMERYCGYLNHFGHTGDVMAESRGGAEDRELKKEYSRLVAEGTYYHPATFFSRALTSKELKLKPKSANVCGLQLADLLAHPSKHDVLSEFGRIAAPLGLFKERLRRAMRGHYNRQVYTGRIKGYGMILL
jgi:hypothetical protein